MKSLFAGVVLAGAMSSASAVTLTFGVDLIGSTTLDTGDITAGTMHKTIPTADQVSSCTGDPGACTTAGIVTGGAATFSTGTLNTTLGPDAFTVTAGLLTLSFTSVEQSIIVATTSAGPGSISLHFRGTITGDSSVGKTFLGQPAIISETCTQTGPGAVITCSESVITSGQAPPPPSAHDIPTASREAIALMALLLAAAGAFMIRRRMRSPR
jgi:hypothetical protein